VSASDFLDQCAHALHRYFSVPVNAGWTASHVNGADSQEPMGVAVNTTVAINSRGMVYSVAQFLRGSDADASYIDWDKKLVMAFSISRTNSDAEVIARVQLKEVNTEGNLAAKGIGILMKNLAVWGEAYDTAREEVDLSTALTSTYPYEIRIEHDPATGVRFYVDNILAGTSTREPSGDAGGSSYLVISIINGGTGGVDAIWHISPIEIWQET